MDDFGCRGEVEYDVTVEALKASVIAGLIRIFAPPGHKIKINEECWVVGSDEKLIRCDRFFPRLAVAMNLTVAEKVEAIAAEGHIGRRRLWGGAGVQVATVRSSGDIYPPSRFVITPFAGQLSWLFESLQIAFAGSLDYGRLADAADRSTAGSAQGLISAVLAEARLLAEEFGDAVPIAIDSEESP